MEKNNYYQISPEGRAYLIAIDTGLIREDENWRTDLSAFMAFWNRIDEEVIRPEVQAGVNRVKSDWKRDRKCYWWLTAVISAVAIALGLLGLSIAGMMR